MHERTRLFWLFLAGGVAIGGVAVADPFGGVPHTFQADTVISAGQMNANFDSVKTYINALETRLNVSNAALAEVTARLDGVATVPAGTIVAFGGMSTNVPVGWEFCDGRSLSRTDPKYAALFAAIGTAHGGAATTFNLPDYRGVFLRGANSGSGKDPDAATRVAAAPGGNTGAQIGTVQQDALQNITGQLRFREYEGADSSILHPIGTSGNAFVRAKVSSSWQRIQPVGVAGNYDEVSFDASRVARTSTETRPVNAAVHYIIKL